MRPRRGGGTAHYLASTILMLLLAGCEQHSDARPAQTNAQDALNASTPEAWPGAPAFVARFVELRQQSAERLQQDVAGLCASIQQLNTSPDPSALNKARSSWNYAHDAYLAWQTFDSGFRDRKQALRQAQQIDAWPIMPGYIDSTVDHPRSGIVYDTTVGLDLDSLLEQHQLTDLSEVSIGFHALEFLLWGEHGEHRRDAGDYSTDGLKDVEKEVVRRRQTYAATLCQTLKDAAGQLISQGLPEKILSARIIDSLAEVISALLLEQRIVTQLEAHVPDPECGFSETPMCGILPIASALRAIFLGDGSPQATDTIVAHVRQHPEQFGDQLQSATENALGTLEGLSDPMQREDLFAAEAMTRSWLAEVRSLQRSITRPGSRTVEQP